MTNLSLNSDIDTALAMAAFGPDVLKVVRQAFDEAWASVADNFSPEEHEPAREALALYE